MEVRQFDECCVCEEPFNGDPYLLKAQDGSEFLLCDSCYFNIIPIMVAEGITFPQEPERSAMPARPGEWLV